MYTYIYVYIVIYTYICVYILVEFQLAKDKDIILNSVKEIEKCLAKITIN